MHNQNFARWQFALSRSNCAAPMRTASDPDAELCIRTQQYGSSLRTVAHAGATHLLIVVHPPKLGYHPPTHPRRESQNLHYLLKQSHHRLRPGRPQVTIAAHSGHGAASRRRMGGWTRHQIRCWRPAMILQGLQRRKAPLWLAHSIPTSMPARDGVMPTPSSRTDPRNRQPRRKREGRQTRRRAGERAGVVVAVVVREEQRKLETCPAGRQGTKTMGVNE